METLHAPRAAVERAARVQPPGEFAFSLAGDPRFEGAWGPVVGLAVRRLAGTADPGVVSTCLEAISARIDARRQVGGTDATGVAVMLTFEALAGGSDAKTGPPTPRVVALEIDASLAAGGSRDSRIAVAPCAETVDVEEARRRAQNLLDAPMQEPDIPRAVGSPRTSLGRTQYCRAVERILERIAAGDVYQANLTQMLSVESHAVPHGAWGRMLDATPAPRSAFFAVPGVAVASVSPEIFLDVDSSGRCTTWPIKGTRPRERDADADRRVAADLLASEKDLAELVMIIDLERNDLSKVSEVGSVRTGPIPELRSYAAVHHLVARVTSQLRPQVGFETLLDATFPGGSISGAPKESALRILAREEPCRRGPYTGSLFWFGDDGTLRSSILIRTVVFTPGRAWLGAGGGIVADSDPEAEWRESNDKARALAAVLGFEPEDAR